MKHLFYSFLLACVLAPTAHAQIKISALPSGTPVTTDVLPYVSDPAGTPATKKTTITNLFGVLTPSLVNSSNKNGNGSKFQLFTGSASTNDCAKFDASGNIVTSSAACGTVTSVGLSVPGILFSVSGSPVTSSGSFSFSLLTQNANKVFAGPTTGADATPTFRALVAADLPTHTHAASDITSGTLPEARGGTNQSTYALGDLLYSSATNTLSKLSGNTTTTKKYLSQTGSGSASAAPAWSQPSSTDLNDIAFANCPSSIGVSFGGATTGITYTTQTCRYNQIGKKVYVHAYFVLSSKGSATGQAKLINLPVTPITTSNNFMAINVSWVNGLTLTGNPVGYIDPATGLITLQVQSNGSVTNMTDATFSNTSSMMVAGEYEVP